MRQRGAEGWQLRVFVGRDPVTGRKRWTTRTIRGGKREAQRALAAMIAEVDRGAPGTDATLAVLLERWFEVASPDWAPGTVTHTRSADFAPLPPEGSLASSPLLRSTTRSGTRTCG